MRVYSILILCLGLVIQSCNRGGKFSSFNENGMTLSLCQLISDDSTGESWEIVQNVSVSQNPVITDVLAMMESTHKPDPIGIPMTPYLDLIICRDYHGNPLFAIAQKSSGACVRISSFEIRDNKILISGDKVFETLVYSGRVELAERLRKLFPK